VTRSPRGRFEPARERRRDSLGAFRPVKSATRKFPSRIISTAGCSHKGEESLGLLGSAPAREFSGYGCVRAHFERESAALVCSPQPRLPCPPVPRDSNRPGTPGNRLKCSEMLKETTATVLISYSGFFTASLDGRKLLILLVGAGRFERPTPCAQGGCRARTEMACFQVLTFLGDGAGLVKLIEPY
jgi:hypothetical protein